MAKRAKYPPADMKAKAESGVQAAEFAVSFWKSHAQTLVGLGRLSDLDYPAFEMLAWVYGRLKSGEMLLAEEGETVQSWTVGRDPHEVTVKHPAAAAVTSLRQQYRALAAEFGMTPKSRGLLKNAAADPDDDDDTEGGKFT